MIKYNDIVEAKELLNLPERVSMEEIKSNYRKLIMQWHPDKCNGNREQIKDQHTFGPVLFVDIGIIAECPHQQHDKAYNG